MAQSTKDQVIDTTSALLEAQGYHATGLNQIIQESGSPKGSLYYYFPEGKEELTAAAISRSGEQLARRIEQGLAAHEHPAEAVRHLTDTIASYVESSGFQAGGPLTMVAVETANTSERINQACRQAFFQMQQPFRRKLEDGGLPPERAEELAEFITSVIEGATILSRTFHSGDPLRKAGRQLFDLIKGETN